MDPGRSPGPGTPEDELLDPEQVAANQRGFVTANQRVTLDRAVRAAGRAVALRWAILAAVVIVATGLSLSSDIRWGWLGALSLVILLPEGVTALRTLLRLRRAQGEIESIAIRSCLGRMNQTELKPVPDVPGQELHLHEQALLMPGSYRFYFLEHSGWVLSAERLGVASLPERQHSAVDHQSRLCATMEAAGMEAGPDDLAANRAGRLTQAQARRLRWQTAGHWFNLAVALAVPAFFVWLVQSGVAVDTLGAVCLAAILLACVAFGVLELFAAFRMLADARDGIIAAVEGEPALVVERQPRGGPKHYCQVTGLKLEIPEELFRVVEESRRYRFYITSRSHRLVALELADAPFPEGR